MHYSPKVSVVVPVYNVEKYLTKCMDSIINQELTDIEIICINDGSDDNSGEIINDYARRDSRISIYNTNNQSSGPARNLGLEMAMGEYVGFVDADDWIEPNMFNDLYNRANNNDCDIIICNFNLVDVESGKALDIKSNYDLLFDRKFDEAVFTWHDIKDILFDLHRYSWNKIYRREFLEEKNVKFSNIRYYQDNIFFYKALLNTDKLSFTRNCYYNYLTNRKGSNSASPKKPLYLFDVNEDIKNEVLLEIGNKEIIDRFERRAIKRYLYYWSSIDAGIKREYFLKVKNYVKNVDIENNPYLSGEEKVVASRMMNWSYEFYLTYETLKKCKMFVYKLIFKE